MTETLQAISNTNWLTDEINEQVVSSIFTSQDEVEIQEFDNLIDFIEENLYLQILESKNDSMIIVETVKEDPYLPSSSFILIERLEENDTIQESSNI